MHNDLLVHQNRLMVSNENILRTRLCDEFHRPAHRAHPERGKMRGLKWNYILIDILAIVQNASVIEIHV
jgi:hypothetical protein